jgi:beta-glucanase (GH16 family)
MRAMQTTKRLIFSGLLVRLGLAVSTTAAAPAGFQLVWSDEFEGAAVNEQEWTHRIGKAHFSVCEAEAVSLENGCMKVRAARTGDHYTGGGLITKRKFLEGYFEARIKLDGGRGWHDAFWTTWLGSMADRAPELKTKPRIEIDALEHYPTFDAHKFSYGIIEWYPMKGGLSRATHTTPADLGADFHLYGFEVTSNYCNFFFDDQLIQTTDLRGVEQTDFHLWLTAIATASNAVPKNGGTLFDYLRCYQADAATYARRQQGFGQKLDQDAGPTKSRGVDLWVEVADFAKPGGWQVMLDQGARVLRGHEKKDKARPPEQLVASTRIAVATAGTYRLWVRGRDFASEQPGKRNFAVTVNGVRSQSLFGTHHQDGFAWQEGGTFTLPAGEVTLELVDTSQYYARCHKLLLTTDLDFHHEKTGPRSNVKHLDASAAK